MKPFLFFDYEGTLATSIRRHFVQYVEALSRIRKALGLSNLAELQPISEPEFLERLPIVKNVGNLLPLEGKDPSILIARALLQRTHSEIIWEYNPDHMLLETVFPGNLEALTELSSVATEVVISYTRQRQEDFATHLECLEIVASNRITRENVFTVGADGTKSQQAKAACLKDVFGTAIANQQQQGYHPLMVGDAITAAASYISMRG